MRAGSTAKGPEGNFRILIVEDHPIIAAGLNCMIEDLGHKVIGIVSEGPEAIQIATAHDPDLVIMDVQLEGEMNGVAAAILIRQKLGIPCVFFSGHLDDEARQRAKLAEPIGFLDKTAAPSDLRAVIERASSASVG